MIKNGLCIQCQVNEGRKKIEERHLVTNDTANENVEDQKGLQFGETGTVISGNISDNYRAEITPEAIAFLDEYYHEDRDKDYKAKEGVFVEVTISYIFDREEVEDYYAGDQIVTYAQ